MDYGVALAITGAALAAFLAGIGSSVGLGIAGRSATGVLSEKPERYGSLTLMVVLPSTQGVYGFVIALMVMVKMKMFGGPVPDISVMQGLQILAACLPVGVAGLFSAIHQGKTSAGGILMAAKKPDMAVKAGVLYSAMVELYAILGFLISLLIIRMGIDVTVAG
ncbi:MAG: V-type ATP synthase subunit K [Planctomycetota bacterium]|jgi:V/A-type H+-transporting ATPase subunit K